MFCWQVTVKTSASDPLKYWNGSDLWPCDPPINPYERDSKKEGVVYICARNALEVAEIMQDAPVASIHRTGYSYAKPVKVSVKRKAKTKKRGKKS